MLRMTLGAKSSARILTSRATFTVATASVYRLISLFIRYCNQDFPQTISLTDFWSGRPGSNWRPPGPKPGALPLGHAPTITPANSVQSVYMVPPERIELSSLAPEASTLSAELQGHSKESRITRNSVHPQD